MDIVTYADYKISGYTDEEIRVKGGMTNNEWRETLIKLGVLDQRSYRSIDGGDEGEKVRGVEKLKREYLPANKTDDAFIEENCWGMSDDEIARVLKKPVAYIGMRRAMLGISSIRGRWSDKEKRFLEENYETMKDVELAYVLDRTTDSVRTKRKKMGLLRDRW